MRLRLQHVLIAGLLAAGTMCAHAQISDPNALVVGPPKPKAPPKGKSDARAGGLGNLQWMWQYAQPTPNGNAVALRNDERFPTLLADAFHQPQAFWGKQVPLSEVIPRFLARYGEINAKDNRYLAIDGCVPSFCAAHGLLWIDLGAPQPLLVFAAVNWTTENHTVDEASADYNLWLFPSREMGADALPFALTSAISDWDARLAQASRGVPHVVHAILVEPDGKPFPLNPSVAGANTLPPQADTITPKQGEQE